MCVCVSPIIIRTLHCNVTLKEIDFFFLKLSLNRKPSMELGKQTSGVANQTLRAQKQHPSISFVDVLH